MKITKQARHGWLHHSLDIEGIPYFRNENFEYNTHGVLVNRNVSWSVGDAKGNGPYVEPGGPLDLFKKYTPDELEKEFNEKFK